MGGLRVGIVGAGAWARTVHIPAAAACERARLAGVLVRSDPGDLPADVPVFVDLRGFLDAVDIVGFAVPPRAQSGLAAAVIGAGKHVLLEKPVALSEAEAYALAAAADHRGVHSISFFPHRLDPEVSEWARTQRERGGWGLGRAESFSSVLVDATDPFHTAWRSATGALWDLGPHSVAQLCAVLGAVEEVAAVRGRDDVTVLQLLHEEGALSTIGLGASFPPPAPAGSGTVFAGKSGQVVQPRIDDWPARARGAARLALRHLADQAEHGAPPHPSDLAFGAHVTAVLAAAERALVSGRREKVVPRPASVAARARR